VGVAADAARSAHSLQTANIGGYILLSMWMKSVSSPRLALSL
jgi:hypothetical protein